MHPFDHGPVLGRHQSGRLRAANSDGVDGLVPHMKADGIQIAFDATSAYVHAENSRKLNELGVLMVDLTPAAIGPLCVPPVRV